MTERPLSTRQLNRALLARQLLLERSSSPLTDALEQVAGLQAQYAPSPYVGLWSRLRDFHRDQLTTALERRQAVQATLLRVTIHVVSAADYPLLTEAVRGARLEWWARAAQPQLEGADVRAAAALVRRRLADGPARQAELVKLLTDRGFPRAVWIGVGLLVDMVRVPPSGTWERRRADLYGLASDWLGPWQVDEADALEHLVRRYLAGFGPASLGDLGSWAGMPLTRLRPALERVGTRRFRDERGGELFDLPGAPLPDPETPAPARFLSTWDANLLVHARRTQLLPERHRPRIFSTRTPHSFPTFLVDGAVAGTWRHQQGRVELEPFEPLPRATRRQLEDEAERLALFHQG
ncbi:MAG TPA: winged helix DNA-binding domain-containing protein [Actinomycetota bacterium]|nr:winged helix DNA-binding domain-containing protein [Actinomycetota bacterium]